MPCMRVAERDREDARRSGWRRAACRRSATCGRDRSIAARAQWPPRPCRSRRDRAPQRDVGAARGKGAFVRQRRRQPIGRHARPRLAAVLGRDQDHELAVDRIADGEPAVGVPERHRVEERLRVVVRELQRPGLAGVRRLVDARRGPLPMLSRYAMRIGDGVDVAKIQLVFRRRRQSRPPVARRSRCGGSSDPDPLAQTTRRARRADATQATR